VPRPMVMGGWRRAEECGSQAAHDDAENQRQADRFDQHANQQRGSEATRILAHILAMTPRRPRR